MSDPERRRALCRTDPEACRVATAYGVPHPHVPPRLDRLTSWVETVVITAQERPELDLDELFAQARRIATAAEGRPVCFAANTTTIRRLAEHLIPADDDAPPWRPHDPARLFALPIYVDDDLPDDVIEPRTTHPTRPTEETAP